MMFAVAFPLFPSQSRARPVHKNMSAWHVSLRQWLEWCRSWRLGVTRASVGPPCPALLTCVCLGSVLLERFLDQWAICHLCAAGTEECSKIRHKRNTFHSSILVWSRTGIAWLVGVWGISFQDKRWQTMNSWAIPVMIQVAFFWQWRLARFGWSKFSSSLPWIVFLSLAKHLWEKLWDRDQNMSKQPGINGYTATMTITPAT